jgi:SnoaL-like protein
MRPDTGIMSDQLPAPVQAALDAANRNDADAFAGLFASGGFVDDWGRTFTGREAIRRWSDAEFIGQRVSLAVTEVSPGSDAAETVVAAQVGGDGFTGPSHFTFRVAGDQLASMTIRA